MATAMTAPGDVVLAPNPSYPIHTFGFIIAGATIRAVPVTPDENYWRALDRAMVFTVPRPSILIVNYPSNPTAETVDLAFTSGWWPGRKRTRSGCCRTSPIPSSITTAIPHPRSCRCPAPRMSRWNSPACPRPFRWRAGGSGFAVGNRRLIAALTRVKSYLDYGAFTPIQAAACAALNGPQDIVERNRELYQKRRDVMVEAFGRAGWEIPSPKASMFAWAPLPPALKDMGSLEFCKQLLTHAEVAVAPGVGYGEDGEGFVRIAMVENETAAAAGGAQYQALSGEHGGECGGDEMGVIMRLFPWASPF